MMEINEIKEKVIEAGLKLVKSGLIARTWGNISCRVDDDTFAITPSGKSYDSLTKEDIVLCKIEDCSYEGDVKPSSERGIHALLYKTHKDINFVIHTHQVQGSIVSAIGIDKFETRGFSLLGKSVPIAKYALPGTKSLRKNIEDALRLTDGNAIIMSNHGAICFGSDDLEAFNASVQLENASSYLINKIYLTKSKKIKNLYENEYFEYYISSILKKDYEFPDKCNYLGNSSRTLEGFTFLDNAGKKFSYDLNERNLPKEALIHQAIYKKRKDINFIRQNTDRASFSISSAGLDLLPFLDDFAQIVGYSAKCAKDYNPDDVIKKLGKSSCVFVKDAGALCCASTESDIIALSMVVKKNALCEIASKLTGKGKVLPKADCALMHLVYTKSYSKKNKTS